MTPGTKTLSVMGVLAFVALFITIWVVFFDSPLFAEENLARIVLQEDEAPEGMTFVESESGALEASDLTRNEAELAKLERDGFVAAYDSIFASPGMAGVPGDVIGSGAGIVDSSVFIFESVEGSIANFERLRAEVPSSFSSNHTLFPISVEGLGDESLALRVEFSNTATGPDVAILYLWRVENAILRLIRWGEIVDENEDVRPIVDLMNSHLSR